MFVEKNIPLQALNTFRIVAKAHALVRVTREQDVRAVLADPEWAATPEVRAGRWQQRRADRRRRSLWCSRSRCRACRVVERNRQGV